tara:strand:+ start:1330 stop:1716 length:387 start_codon:yes stop_codon:yes gene_type:complete
MHWFTIKNNVPVQHRPGKMIVMPDGSKQPHSITLLWSAADLLAAGVYEGAPAAVPDGQRVTAREWAWTGSAVEETITTEAMPPEPTRQERFDQSASVGNPLTDALIAGLAEVKGITVPDAKVWLRGLV